MRERKQYVAYARRPFFGRFRVRHQTNAVCAEAIHSIIQNKEEFKDPPIPPRGDVTLIHQCQHRGRPSSRRRGPFQARANRRENPPPNATVYRTSEGRILCQTGADGAARHEHKEDSHRSTSPFPSYELVSLVVVNFHEETTICEDFQMLLESFS